jgi:hypothetical protein
MRYVFDYAEHQEGGWNGWRPKWIPGADPLGALVVPHDILEHGRGDSGSIADELIAFGRMLYIRAEGGYWHRLNDVHGWAGHTQAEFVDFVNQVGQGKEWPSIADPRISKKPLEDWESEIQKFCTGISDFIRREFSDDEFSVDDYFSPVQLKAMAGLFRYGYRDAQKRYPNSDETAVLFRRIEVEAERIGKFAELGDQLIITIVKSTNKCTINHRVVRD